MKRLSAAVGALIFARRRLAIADATRAAPEAQPPKAPATLPKDIVWETNNDEPLIGSPNAIRGGRFNTAIGAYPLTFRIMGPNNNDFFAAGTAPSPWRSPWCSCIPLRTSSSP